MFPLSPGIRIVLYVCLLAAVFAIGTIKYLLPFLFLISLLTMIYAPSSLKKGMVPVSLFLLFTFAGNILFQEGEVIYNIAGVDVTHEGLQKGGLLTIRLFVLILGARLLTAVTGSEALLNGVKGLIGPVGRIPFVNDLLLTMALTLRLLPVIYDEASSLYSDVMKSGANGLSGKIRLSVSLLAPLFERSLQKARNLNAGAKGDES